MPVSAGSGRCNVLAIDSLIRDRDRDRGRVRIVHIMQVLCCFVIECRERAGGTPELPGRDRVRIVLVIPIQALFPHHPHPQSKPARMYYRSLLGEGAGMRPLVGDTCPEPV